MKVGILVLLLMGSVLRAGPIGVSNHNPGNIRDVRWRQWQGAVGIDPYLHIRFKSDFWGLRAIRVNLTSYAAAGVNTPYGIGARWGSLKATKAQRMDYCRMLCQVTGAKAGDRLDLMDPAVMKRVAHGIVRQENGSDPYPARLYDRVFVSR